MLSQNAQEQIKQLAKHLGLYVYDIELLKDNEQTILRISITRKSPYEKSNAIVSLQDCEALSTLISPLLDVEMPHLNNYHFEVSSPGLERTLKSPQHYAFSLGEYICIKLNDKRILKGILESVNDDSIVLNDNHSKNIVEIAFKDIKKAKVVFEF